MSGILTYVKAAGLTAALVCGMAVVADNAQAHGRSQDSVRNAQQQLKNSGYYNGPVDGIDGPMTRAAIKKYQSDQSLTVNGRLDQETRDKLGLSNMSGASNTGEASRSAAENGAQTRPQPDTSRQQPNAPGQIVPSSATISAAQRALQQKGFYKGNIDGNMGAETQAAIREYQKNSNLNTTGKLDQATLSSLGVSK